MYSRTGCYSKRFKNTRWRLWEILNEIYPNCFSKSEVTDRSVFNLCSIYQIFTKSNVAGVYVGCQAKSALWHGKLKVCFIKTMTGTEGTSRDWVRSSWVSLQFAGVLVRTTRLLAFLRRCFHMRLNFVIFSKKVSLQATCRWSRSSLRNRTVRGLMR